eukprot:gene415-372_t
MASDPVLFVDAMLAGFAPDGGMYFPERVPSVTACMMEEWKDLSFADLAAAVLCLYIDDMSFEDIASAADTCFPSGAPPILMHTIVLDGSPVEIAEMFHGSTLAFKDIPMTLAVGLMDRVMHLRQSHLTLACATSGDTGSAAAAACVGKELQMTTINAPNVCVIGVEDANSDALDSVLAQAYFDRAFVTKTNLASINSVNVGRLLSQVVAHVFTYFRAVEKHSTAEVPYPKLTVAIPCGGCGNLTAGLLARKMGLPIEFVSGVTASSTFCPAEYNLARPKANSTPAHRLQKLSAPRLTLQPRLADWMKRYYQGDIVDLDARKLACFLEDNSIALKTCTVNSQQVSDTVSQEATPITGQCPVIWGQSCTPNCTQGSKALGDPTHQGGQAVSLAGYPPGQAGPLATHRFVE